MLALYETGMDITKFQNICLGKSGEMCSGSASDAKEDLQKFITAKQWKKVEETSSKLSMAITTNKRAADKLEDLQSKRKKVASKK